MSDVAAAPPFLRESMWRLLAVEERDAIQELLSSHRQATSQLTQAVQEIERHRKLSRDLASRAKSLLDELHALKERQGTDPRLDELMEDLGATVEFPEERRMGPEDEGEMAPILTYTAPPGTSVPELETIDYEGELEPID